MQNFVFDLYGTLVDIHTDEGGEKFKKAIAARFKTPDFWQKYSALCREMEDGSLREIDLFKVFSALCGNPERAAEYFRKKSRKRLKVYRGAKQLLIELKRRGKGVYLLTNAQACFTLDELKKLGLISLFDGVCISSEAGYKKPAREIFERLLSDYGLDAADCVYAGNDLACDVIGAKSAGFATAYIKSNLSPAGDSLPRAAVLADFATDDFSKLKNYLLSLC